MAAARFLEDRGSQAIFREKSPRPGTLFPSISAPFSRISCGPPLQYWEAAEGLNGFYGCFVPRMYIFRNF